MRSDEWTTPDKLYQYLDEKFNFNLDTAASKKNTKCRLFYSKENSFIKKVSTLTDLFNKDWRIWCNPPYSMDRLFAKACLMLYLNYEIDSVLLLPVRSDRIWYNKLKHSKGVREIPFTGRIHFGNAKGGAFMYSVLFIIGFKDVPMPKYLDAGQFNKNGKGSAKT